MTLLIAFKFAAEHCDACVTDARRPGSYLWASWPGSLRFAHSSRSIPEAFGPGGGGSEFGPWIDCQRMRSRMRCGTRSGELSGSDFDSLALVALLELRSSRSMFAGIATYGSAFDGDESNASYS